MNNNPSKAAMYFISTKELSDIILDIDDELLASTPQDALIKYMHSQYDTCLGGDKVFRLSNKHSLNIYNYRINLYKVDPKYLHFISKYENTSLAIYANDDDKLLYENLVKSVYPNEAIFLKEFINKYGMNIAHVDEDSLLEKTKEQLAIVIDKVNGFIDNMEPDDSFIRMIDIPDEINNPIEWSYSLTFGEYELSETVDMDYERASTILDELVKIVEIKLDKKYYISIQYSGDGYGTLELSRRETIKEYNINAPTGVSLWNTILESGDGFCGINFNIKDLYYSNVVECIDLSEEINNIPNRNIISESRKVYGGEFTPIYIVLTNTKDIVSKVVNTVTASPYNHVSISFDPNLNTLYSFSSYGLFKRAGFNIETIKRSYLDRFDDVNTQIYTVFVNQNQLRKINSYIDSTLANYKNEKYNFVGLLGYILNKPMGRENKKFCSEFVDEIFKLVDIDLTEKESGLVKPYDFANSNASTIFKVYEGKLEKLNPDKIGTMVSNIFRNNKNVITEDSVIYNEAKSFPVQFDEHGNILIRNMKKLNYQSEYENSHRLLGLYEKNRNMEGIKFELSKLWFLNSLIEEKLYARIKPSRNKSKKYIDIRARILNDFHKYLTFVGKYDSDFNFSEYYEDTPFSDAEIKIHKDTVDAIGKIVKSMIGLI